jgi:excinuclease ABC subunit B
MYADTVTGSMERAIGETNRRRAIQSKYNEDNNITPKSIEKKVRELISISKKIEDSDRKAQTIAKDPESMTLKELESEAERLRKLMNKAAAELEFEKAAELRDRMVVIRKHIAEVAL